MSARTASATLLITLVGATAAAVFRTPQQGPPAAPARGEAPKPAAKASGGAAARQFPTARLLLQNFFRSQRSERGRDPYDLPVGTLIATVPDPTDSHMDWAFDSYLESIRRAYETSGYVLDSFWVPWGGASDTMLVQGAGAVGRRVREEYPGVMLFRRPFTLPDSAAPAVAPGEKAKQPAGRAAVPLREAAALERPDTARELQIVFLVGEVPTGGVHKGALLRALLTRDSLPLAHTDPVRIVGPSFSGSTASLAWALREWSERTHRTPRSAPVHIISGAATVARNAVAFRNAGPNVDLRATVNTDSSLTRMLLVSVLCRLNIRDDQVLLLRESGTYGSEAARADRAGQADRAPCGRDTLSSARFLQIPFPMNVASLRAEYEAHPRAPAEADGAEAEVRARVSLLDPDRPMDHLPATSVLTAPALEVLLNQIEDAVVEHHIRAVGIVASDVRDKLFLVEKLRRRLRDAQFFTYEGNALFLTPRDNPAFRGMLVLSTYPLTLQNQWWSGNDGQQRLPFPSEGSQGLYNAVLLQLGAADQLSEYATPLVPGVGPPVWLSVVGSRTFVPLSVEASGDTGYVAPGPSARRHGQEPLGVSFFTTVAVLLLSAGVLAFSSAVLRRDPGLEPFGGQPGRELADRVQWGSMVLHRHLYAFLRLLALLSVFVPVSVLVFTAVARNAGGALLRTLLQAALLDAGVLALALAVTDEVRWRAAAQQRKEADPSKPRRGRGNAPPATLAGAGGWSTVAAVALAGAVVVSVAAAALLGLSGEVKVRWDRWIVYLMFCTAFVGVGAALWHLYIAGRCAWRLLPDGSRYARKGWAGCRPAQLAWWGEIGARTLVVGVGLAYFGASLWFTRGIIGASRQATYPLLLSRLSRFDSGVSPILPLALAGAGYAIWCSWHLRRIALLKHSTPFEAACWRAAKDLPCRPHRLGERREDRPRDTVAAAAEDVASVRERLFMVIPDAPGVAVLAFLLVLALMLAAQFHPTIEAISELSGFDLLLRIAMVGSLVSTAWAVYRLVALWEGLVKLLETVGDTPLLPAFGRLPHAAAQLTRLTLWVGTSCDLVQALALAQWRQLRTLYQTGNVARDISVASDTRRKIVDFMKTAPGEPSHRDDRKPLSQREDTLFTEVWKVLEAFWHAEPDSVAVKSAEELLKGKEKTDTGSVVRQHFATPARLWLRAAEEFAAVQFVDYVEWVLQQMRTLAVFLFVTLLATTALVSSYPFQPQSTVKLVFGAVVLVTVASNRNQVLSHIADTDPGRVTWNWSFALNVGLVAVVPLLTLLSSELPGLHSALFSWIQPVLKAITHSG